MLFCLKPLADIAAGQMLPASHDPFCRRSALFFPLHWTGAGSTAAGLTCAAVRDSSSRGWQLDPGVLVLADRGVCCLDDLNLMRKDAQAAVLEAMEQQSISVAKVGYTLICSQRLCGQVVQLLITL